MIDIEIKSLETPHRFSIFLTYKPTLGNTKTIDKKENVSWSTIQETLIRFRKMRG